jgi:uncharacterized protein YukE
MNKTLCLSVLAAITFLNPYGQEAFSSTTPVVADKDNREYRKSPTGQGALTPQMIEACIRLSIDIESERAAIEKTRQEFDKLNKEVTDLGEYLKTVKVKVDQGDRAARVEYDEKVLFYNSQLPTLDNLLRKYQAMAKNWPGEKGTRFERECNGQPYYEDDYAEISKKMGRGL